jgi:uncharacterized protein YxeA
MPITDKKQIKTTVEEVKTKETPAIEEKETSEEEKKNKGFEPVKETAAVNTSVSSFGLIDDKKANMEIKTKPEEKKEEATPIPTEPQKSGDVSATEVNKWIENYDETNQPKKEGKSVFKVILFILLGLSLVAIIAGGFLYYQKNMSKTKTEVTPTSTPQESPTAAPTEKPASPSGTVSKVKFSDYSINLLNGSGIPGEAGKAKALLADAKFKKIDTSNAASYDFTDTEVQLKDNVPSEVYDKIAELLGSKYTVVKSDTVLKSTSLYDVVITIGVEK